MSGRLSNLFTVEADVSAQDFSRPLSVKKRYAEGNFRLFGVDQQIRLLLVTTIGRAEMAIAAQENWVSMSDGTRKLV